MRLFQNFSGQVLAALLTGALVVLAFPRYGGEVGLDGLVWVAFVPLFAAAHGRGWRRGALLGFCSGVLLEAAGFSWILLAIRRFSGLPSPAAAGLFGLWVLQAALPWAALGAILGLVPQGRTALWAIPPWTAVEAYFPRLFPWHVGGALYDRDLLVQCVDLFGASGLSALVLLANAVVHAGLLALARERPWPVRSGVVLLALLTAALLYGHLRLESLQQELAAEPPLEVLLVQGALSPEERNERGLQIYLERTRSALAGGAQPPDLIVWPEGADQWPFDLTPGADPLWVHRRTPEPAIDLRTALPAPLVTGGAAVARERLPRSSNVAVYLPREGSPIIYEKNRRLLFGEQVPFYNWLPRSWKESFAHIGTIFAGTTSPACSLGGKVFRGLICYEAVLPDYVRERAEGTDFFVNITEDVWYGDTAHVPQHLSVLRLRVIENRVPLVRVTNMGPSGIVEATGRFQGTSAHFAPEIARLSFSPRSFPSLYRRGGHLFPLLLLVVWAAAVRWQRRR